MDIRDAGSGRAGNKPGIGWEMKKGIRWKYGILLLAIPACLMAGCGEKKAAKEARLDGIEAMEAGNYEGAIEAFETALGEADGIVNEFELDILQYRGEAEYRLGDYSAAVHTYGILAEVEEKQPEYLYYMAASMAMGGDLEAAKTAFLAAEQREADQNKKPEDSETAGVQLALTAMASAARQAGDGDQAAEFCRKAIERGSSGPEIYNQMGMSLTETGNYEEALRYFENAITLADQETAGKIRQNIGALYEKQGDFSEALAVFRECAAQNGMTPELEKEIAFLESRTEG